MTTDLFFVRLKSELPQISCATSVYERNHKQKFTETFNTVIVDVDQTSQFWILLFGIGLQQSFFLFSPWNLSGNTVTAWKKNRVHLTVPSLVCEMQNCTMGINVDLMNQNSHLIKLELNRERYRSLSESKLDIVVNEACSHHSLMEI